MTRLRIYAAGAIAAALIASSSAPVLATPPSGNAASPIVNGHFGTLSLNTAGDKTGKWGLILKTLDETDVGATRITVQPSGYSGWHAHPGTAFLIVTQGSVTDYDGSNPLCTSHTYTVGQTFINHSYQIHNVVNASSSATAEYIAIAINPTGPAVRIDEPKPNNCNF